jgi:hypothetical protein
MSLNTPKPSALRASTDLASARSNVVPTSVVVERTWIVPLAHSRQEQ